MVTGRERDESAVDREAPHDGGDGLVRDPLRRSRRGGGLATATGRSPATDEIVAGARPEDLSAREVGDEPVDLRWILAHIIEETARHAGHADIVRELLDGRTGR